MTSQHNDKISFHPLLNILLARGTAPVVSKASIRINTMEGDTIRLADAIAFLCVFNSGTGQRAAISFTLSKNQQDVLLCLALNSGSPEFKVHFLESLWTSLKALWHLRRISEGSALIPPNPQADDEISRVKREIAFFCYGYCLSKLARTVRKRWDGFLAFKGIWDTKTCGSREQRRRFGRVASALGNVRHILGDETAAIYDVSAEDLMQIAVMMRQTQNDFKLLSRDSGELQKWAAACKQDDTPEFPLHVYLEKCYELDRSVGVILTFAQKPDPTWIFRRNFIVRPLPTESRQLSMLTTDWPQYVAHVFETAQIVENSGSHILRREADKAMLHSMVEAHRMTPVHCEALLLAHHHRGLRDAAETPPLALFGSSKPACQTCALYFESYRHSGEGPPRFYTRRSVTSLQARYVPWAAPELDDAGYEGSVNRKMYERLCGVYGRRLERAREVSLRAVPLAGRDE